MDYLIFTVLFAALHAAAYMAAGAFILKLSKDVYEGKTRIMDYLRDMHDPEESSHVKRWFLPAQLIRGVLLSLVLYPILPFLGELAFIPRTAYLFGMMFLYTHIASAAPCPDNIEGFVYLRARYFRTSTFLKFQIEMLTYSLLFSIPASFFLF